VRDLHRVWIASLGFVEFRFVSGGKKTREKDEKRREKALDDEIDLKES